MQKFCSFLTALILLYVDQLLLLFEQVFRQICALNGFSYLRNARVKFKSIFPRRRPWRRRRQCLSSVITGKKKGLEGLSLRLLISFPPSSCVFFSGLHQSVSFLLQKKKMMMQWKSQLPAFPLLPPNFPLTPIPFHYDLFSYLRKVTSFCIFYFMN